VNIYVFVPFHARGGCEEQVREALESILVPTRAEPGCLRIHLFRSVRDRALFYIHSRWQSLEAIEQHQKLPHMIRFLAEVEPLVDHGLEAIRTEKLG